MERDLLPGTVFFTLFARGNSFKLKEVAGSRSPARGNTVTAGWERPRHPLPGGVRATESKFPRPGSSQKSSGRGSPAAPALSLAGARQATELAVSSHEMAAGAHFWLSQPGVPQRCLQAGGCPCPAPPVPAPLAGSTQSISLEPSVGHSQAPGETGPRARTATHGALRHLPSLRTQPPCPGP